MRTKYTDTLAKFLIMWLCVLRSHLTGKFKRPFLSRFFLGLDNKLRPHQALKVAKATGYYHNLFKHMFHQL